MNKQIEKTIRIIADFESAAVEWSNHGSRPVEEHEALWLDYCEARDILLQICTPSNHKNSQHSDDEKLICDMVECSFDEATHYSYKGEMRKITGKEIKTWKGVKIYLVANKDTGYEVALPEFNFLRNANNTVPTTEMRDDPEMREYLLGNQQSADEKLLAEAAVKGFVVGAEVEIPQGHILTIAGLYVADQTECQFKDGVVVATLATDNSPIDFPIDDIRLVNRPALGAPFDGTPYGKEVE